MSELEAYYFPVTITGTALVYDKSKKAAKKFLENAGVMVAGNKMREFDIAIHNHDPIEYTDEVSRRLWRDFKEPPQEKINDKRRKGET